MVLAGWCVVMSAEHHHSPGGLCSQISGVAVEEIMRTAIGTTLTAPSFVFVSVFGCKARAAVARIR
jgi:hypothetical protein